MKPVFGLSDNLINVITVEFITSPVYFPSNLTCTSYSQKSQLSLHSHTGKIITAASEVKMDGSASGLGPAHKNPV